MSLQRVTRTGGKDAIVDAFDILFCSHSPDPMTTVRGRLAAYHAKARISSSVRLFPFAVVAFLAIFAKIKPVP